MNHENEILLSIAEFESCELVPEAESGSEFALVMTVWFV